MQAIKQFSLKNNNSFGVDAKVRAYVRFDTEGELLGWLKENKPKRENLLVLGGGSNFLFTCDSELTVLHPLMKGKRIVKESDDKVWLECGAGEVWDDVVNYAVDNNWGGIENLAYIPGHMGAAPVQNIGAYGTELKDVFYSLSAIEISTAKRVSMNHQDCNFSYRNSFFKAEGFRSYVITAVTLVLDKNPQPKLSYRSLSTFFQGKPTPSIQAVRDAVVQIRKAKLPEPEVIGNAGSFFKNPVVGQAKVKQLLDKFPDLVHFTLPNNEVKLAAGWLIEKVGLKGYRVGDAAVYEKQALVLVNYGNASGQDLYALSKYVQSRVLKKFGVSLECEVNIIQI